MVLFASTQTAIGWVIAALVGIGFIAYLVANMRAAKPELGSEIELAPNRKTYFDDAALETSRLERSQLFALGMLVIIAVALPVYWLAEPARIKNATDGFTIRSQKRGDTLFQANCQRCHGPGGTGGVIATSLTDDAGKFVANVNWKAPALTGVLTRFSEDAVTDTLNYGRNGVMPAWGAPGGGPMTVNNIRDLIIYLRTIQLATPGDKDDKLMRASVDGGIKDGARLQLLKDRPALQAAVDEANRLSDPKAKKDAAKTASDAIDAALADYMKEISDPASPKFAAVYGKAIFNNSASQGAYSCARCHTKGWSYSATDVTDTAGKPLAATYSDGNGWYGPSLQGGSTTRKFNTPATQETFVKGGSEKGKKYGNAGFGDGQMPGFGPRIDDAAKVTFPAILTDVEIQAVVAYERGMQ